MIFLVIYLSFLLPTFVSNFCKLFPSFNLHICDKNKNIFIAKFCDNYLGYCDVFLHFRHTLWQLPRLLWRIPQMSWCRQWWAPRKIKEPYFWRRDSLVYQRLDYCEYIFPDKNLHIFWSFFGVNQMQFSKHKTSFRCKE